MSSRAGKLHHVEIWVPDIDRTRDSWGWLLERLGYSVFQEWPGGVSWKLGETYLVFERSEASSAKDHDRLRPGLNHLAFNAGIPSNVDAIRANSCSYGWRELTRGQPLRSPRFGRSGTEFRRFPPRNG